MSEQPWRCGNCAVLNGPKEPYCNMCGAARGAAGAESAGASAEPAGINLSKIDCSECGAPLNIAESVGRGQVVCESCSSVIDLGSPDYAILHRRMSDAHPPRSNIRVGQVGVFGDVRCRVVGRLAYVDAEGWRWDEWFMVGADGSIRYLEDDGEELVLLEPVTPKAPPPITELQSSTTITIDERRYLVEERSTAKIVYFEGQLPWKVSVDTEVNFADLKDSDGGVIAAEWTKRELEFYQGRRITRQAVARAFGLRALYGTGYTNHDYDDYDNYDSDSSSDAGGAGLVIVIFIIAIIALFALMADGDCGGGGGGYGGGHYSSGGGGFGK